MIQLWMTLVLSAMPSNDLYDRVEHGHADSDGVKIHYASIGEGPLVVMIHGFPDFWYTWRDQMEALSSDFKVVAIDQRGYNRSDKPEGVANYRVPLLVADVAAVIRHHGEDGRAGDPRERRCDTNSRTGSGTSKTAFLGTRRDRHFRARFFQVCS